ncbi:hypothetical protein EBI_26407 [Enterocytozoon bieneusi H348]|nr:hypothetical protein EBI_26407 [Enterocytozoon bieneusi H348]|eukprot:XP_001827879.1 hypothetical protein EBI_26407 [Enterocytozoon bieneusi H348]
MKVNKTMAPKKKKTSQSQKEVCPVEVVDFKINIESIETILQQIHAISSIDTHSVFFIKFRKLLEKYTIIDNNLNNNNDILNDIDKMNEQYLDLCFTRKDTLERYVSWYNEFVVKKIKEFIIYKANQITKINYAEHKLIFTAPISLEFKKKMNELTSLVDKLTKAHMLLDATENKPEETDIGRYIRNYFNEL